MLVLASGVLLYEREQKPVNNVTSIEYWTQASEKPLIPGPALSFLHYR